MQDELGKLLKSWQTSAPDPADFRRKVWLRIEQSPPTALSRFFTWIARPRIASATVAAALLLGALAGAALSERPDGDSYLRSVNPYARLR